MSKYQKLLDEALPYDEYYSTQLHANKLSKNQLSTKYLKPNELGTRHLVPKEERNDKRERVIQYEIIQYLKQQQFWVYKLKAVNLVGSFANDTAALVPTEPGLPDIISVSKEGRVLAIEVKAASGRARIKESQLEQLRRLRKNNAHAIVAHSVKTVADYLANTCNLTKSVDLYLLPEVKKTRVKE